METLEDTAMLSNSATAAPDPTESFKKRKRNPNPAPASHKKLPRLGNKQTVSKRPLLHPAIAPPRTSAATPKIVYISASTPFIASTKRVRSLLDQIEKRSSSSVSLKHGDKKMFKDLEASMKNGGAEGDGKSKPRPRDEEVILKATGKAIENLLRMCVWWQGQEGVRVRVETVSAGAVDDVIGEEGEEEGSRVRRVSCLEVKIGLV